METQLIFWLAFVIIFLYSVILHEVAHGWVALRLGDPTAKSLGRLSLNPVVHIDPIGSVLVPLISLLSFGSFFGWAKPVPYNPYNLRNKKWGHALVGLAGPLANLFLVILAALVLKLDQQFWHLGVYNLGIQAMVLTLQLNVLLLVFNLIPLPPLDGSKVLLTVLPEKWWQLKVGLQQWGFVILLLLIFSGGPVLMSLFKTALKLVTFIFGI